MSKEDSEWRAFRHQHANSTKCCTLRVLSTTSLHVTTIYGPFSSTLKQLTLKKRETPAASVWLHNALTLCVAVRGATHALQSAACGVAVRGAERNPLQ